MSFEINEDARKNQNQPDISQLEKRYRLIYEVFEATHDGVMVTDEQGRIIVVNKAFEAMTGFVEAEVLGENPRLLSSGKHSPDFFKAFYSSLSLTGKWEGEVWNKNKNGVLYLGWLRVIALPQEDGTNYYVGITTDITKIKKSQEDLDFLAHHDSLTLLPNRLFLNQYLEQMLISFQASLKPFALFFLDLDNFKRINDSLGHEVGDELLQKIARRLQEVSPSPCFICRLGGDEFVIVIPEKEEKEGFSDIAEVYVKAFMEAFEVKGMRLYSTISLGVSVFPNDTADVKELVRFADMAMYRAKLKGKNTFEYFKSYMASIASRRQEVESKLRYAIREEKIDMYFQPQVCVVTKQLCGIEVLARWYDNDLGWVEPEKFIELAEDMGLIQNLSDLILRKLCYQVLVWKKLSVTLPLISVNISSTQLDQADFPSKFVSLVESFGLLASSFEIEITESALLSGRKKNLVVLEGLRAAGISIALDDFGTGYSSLSYLAQMPVQRIKIDKSFINDIEKDENNNKIIIRMIIALGKSLGIRIVAEGVENEAQFAFLRSVGCDQTQGFLHAEGLAASEFEKKFLVDD